MVIDITNFIVREQQSSPFLLVADMFVHSFKLERYLGAIVWEEKLCVARLSFLSLEGGRAWTGQINTELDIDGRIRKYLTGDEDASDSFLSEVIDRGFLKQIFEFDLNETTKKVMWKKKSPSGKFKRRLMEIDIEQGEYASVMLSFKIPPCSPDKMTKMRVREDTIRVDVEDPEPNL